MPTNRSGTQTVFMYRSRPTVGAACIEYRIQWDEISKTWDVLRNGVTKDVVAGGKRASAVASAIRDAKAEFKGSGATVVVTCLDGRSLETLWRATQ